MTAWFTLERISICVALLCLVHALIVGHRNGKQMPLERLLSRALAGSAIPPAVFLLICAFDKDQIKKLNELGIYLLAAGVALLYVSLSEIFPRPAPEPDVPAKDRVKAESEQIPIHAPARRN